MISNLINFGKWLVENNQDDFGRNVEDNDWILKVSFINGEFVLNDELELNKDFVPNFKNSIFNNGLLFPPKPIQNFMIPSTTHLPGFSPFCVKIVEKKNLSSFKSKPQKSLDAIYDSKNNKIKKRSKFYKILNKLENDFENNFINYFDNFNLNFSKRTFVNDDEKERFRSFFINHSTEDIIINFIKYYCFIINNFDNIINIVSNKIESEEYKKNNGSFFLVCNFGNEWDLINDILFYYCMLIKERNENYPTTELSNCSFCGNLGVSYPQIPCFGINKEYKQYFSFFNFDNNINQIKLKLCKECNIFIIIAVEKLKSLFDNNILVIPKLKSSNNFEDFFIKVNDLKSSDFSKINNLLKESKDFNFDLVLCKLDKTLMRVFKYIENYQAFLVKFDNIYLYDKGNLNYLFNFKLTNDEIKNSKISNLFSLERIFKDFFVNIKDDKYVYLNKNFNYFYKIYTMPLTTSKGIFKEDYDSSSVSIFSKYMYNIFSLIYELNLDALNKNMINEICLNSLKILEKNNKRMDNGNFLFRSAILKRLNYLFMFKREFLGDNMLSKENMVDLRNLLNNFNFEEESQIDKFLYIVNNDPAFKYFLIGQFIRYIDDVKFSRGKNSNTFSTFISNSSKSNLKKLFVKFVLVDNEFYVKRLGKKGKLIFSTFENYDGLFNENLFDYEDYVLLMFTGYYTNNLLKKDEKKKEDNKND